MPWRLPLTMSLICLGACSGAAPKPASLDQGALLTASCSGCHAEGGSSIVGLAGLSAAQLQAKLLAYRREAGSSTAMHRMARAYSDQQIALIAQTLGQ